MNFKDIREKAGYNRKEASKLLGISESTIRHWECSTRMPSMDKVIKMRLVYDCNYITLMNAYNEHFKEYRNKNAKTCI